MSRTSGPFPKVLLVEGASEKRLIPYLMEKNGVDWPDNAHPVQIREKGGDSGILAPANFLAEVKEPARRVTGIVLDADEDCRSRWTALRQLARGLFPDISIEIPEDGLIVSNDEGQKLGAWIMPDNRSRGMLETWLQFLVPLGDADPLLQFARQVAEEAKVRHHANYKPRHFDKASLHTWLAWQDEPGRQMHDAMKFGMFNPTSKLAQPFVKWFRDLFEV
jgi:hypothetical protein